MKTDEEIIEEIIRSAIVSIPEKYLPSVEDTIDFYDKFSPALIKLANDCFKHARESEREKLLENMETWQKNCVVNQQTERIRELEKLLVLEKENVMKEVLAEIKKTGYWKEGTTTYVVEERVFPHDERCEGTMCYCVSRTKN